MRVIYFHQYFSTPKGSTGIRSYEMARHLLAKGHQVTMVCGSYGGGETGLTQPFNAGRRHGNVAGIDVIEFDLAYSNSDGFVKRASTFLIFAMRSARLVFTEKYDVVFSTTTPLTAGIPGILARWLRGKPFVFEVRDLWPELPRAMGVIRNPIVLTLMSALEWLSYRSANRLIGLSPGIVDGIARRGIAYERITMVPNGCDLNLFANPDRVWRPEGIRDDQLLAVFSGTHGQANGLDAVLDAAAELKSRGRDDIRILLIGEGSEKSRLIERARTERLENLIFMGPIPKTELAGLLAGADIGLQILKNVPAFYFGTSPNKFFDYIAAGLPVLNNYPGWLAEMIEKNSCGFAIPPENTRAFANALEHAVKDRIALKEMGQRAQALAKAEFSRSMLADQWVDWMMGVKI